MSHRKLVEKSVALEIASKMRVRKQGALASFALYSRTNWMMSGAGFEILLFKPHHGSLGGNLRLAPRLEETFNPE